MTTRDPKKARCSSLPVLQFCGMSQTLGATVGGGRDAILGQAFHALASKCPSTDDRLLRLTEAEKKKFDELILPRGFDVETGTETAHLEYANALKEIAIGLTVDGRYVDHGSAEAIVDGTVDMFWVLEIAKKTVVYICDIKRSMHTEPDGPYSLQVTAYALALANLYNADGFVRGIWDATGGEYAWAPYVDMFDEQADVLLKTVVAAARNHGSEEYTLGTHCHRCYARSRCPQYLLPPDLAVTMLADFTKYKDEGGFSEEAMVVAYNFAKRAADTAEEIMEILKLQASINPIFDPATNKVYRPVQCKGRVGFDKKAFEKNHSELAEKYTTFGAPYTQTRWTNPVD